MPTGEDAGAPPPNDPAALAEHALAMKRRTSVGAYDVDAPHLLHWRNMPPEARAAAGAAALFANWPLPQLDLETMRYDQRARIVFVVMSDPHVKEGNRRVASRAVPKTVDASVVAVRAAFGARAEELHRFIKRRV